jgi:hypothetical protein
MWDHGQVKTAGWRAHVVGVLVLIGLTGIGASACSSPGQTAVVKAQTGWLTHRYGSVLISAPTHWYIYRNTDCVPSEHPGALVLGVGSGPGTCVDQVGPPGTVVKLSGLSPGALLTLPPPVSKAVRHVHGLTIQSSTYSSGVTIWIIPSAGIEVSSRGPNGRIVLETLRPA